MSGKSEMSGLRETMTLCVLDMAFSRISPLLSIHKLCPLSIYIENPGSLLLLWLLLLLSLPLLHLLPLS